MKIGKSWKLFFVFPETGRFRRLSKEEFLETMCQAQLCIGFSQKENRNDIKHRELCLLILFSEAIF